MKFNLLFICLFFSTFSQLLNGEEKITAYGDLYEATCEVIYPKSIPEIQKIIKEAQIQQQKVCIVGRGMSQGEQSLLDHSILIDMKYINKMSLEDKVLSVGAGALWKDIQSYINMYGLALQVMQGSNIFSVGGSLSANCHGWDFRSGTLANTIQEITLVNSKGELERIVPSHPLFHYVIGGYGCFGVIVEAKIKLRDNVPICEASIEIPLKDYLNYFQTVVQPSPQIIMHRYRLSLESKNFFKQGIATDYIQTGNQKVISNLQEDLHTDKLIQKGIWISQNLPFMQDYCFKLAKRKILEENLTTLNQVMSPPTRFHFRKQTRGADWLQEFFISEDELENFVSFLGETLQKHHVPMINATIRYLPKETRYPLSYTKDKNQFAVVLFFRQNLSSKKVDETQEWVKKVIDYLIEHDGSFYLPYQHFATTEQFHACYPNWKIFCDMKNFYDPNELFSNGFYQDYFLGKKIE